MEVYSLVYAIITVILVISVAYLLYASMAKSKEDFQQQNIKIVNSMRDPIDKRTNLATALLAFDPRQMKYYDPKRYDIHFAGAPTQLWRTLFLEYIQQASDLVLEHILAYTDVIVVFDGPNLSGNAIFLPIEGKMPIRIQDEVLFRKYIMWKPPSNVISCIIPNGYRLRFDLVGITKEGREDIQQSIIVDGITRTYAISQPIVGLYIEINDAPPPRRLLNPNAK